MEVAAHQSKQRLIWSMNQSKHYQLDKEAASHTHGRQRRAEGNAIDVANQDIRRKSAGTKKRYAEYVKNGAISHAHAVTNDSPRSQIKPGSGTLVTKHRNRRR